MEPVISLSSVGQVTAHILSSCDEVLREVSYLGCEVSCHASLSGGNEFAHAVRSARGEPPELEIAEQRAEDGSIRGTRARRLREPGNEEPGTGEFSHIGDTAGERSPRAYRQPSVFFLRRVAQTRFAR